MTYTERATGSVDRLVHHFGGSATATIRRSGPGLVNRATGAALTTLTVNGTVAAGASSVDLDGAAIEGTLGQGWRFTLPGHTAPYEVQADVTAASNELGSVSISPVLSHEATDDSTATITRHYGEWSYPVMRREFQRHHVDGEVIAADDYLLILSLLGASFTEINTAGDLDRITFDGKARTIVRILPLEPGNDPAALRLHCRG